MKWRQPGGQPCNMNFPTEIRSNIELDFNVLSPNKLILLSGIKVCSIFYRIWDILGSGAHFYTHIHIKRGPVSLMHSAEMACQRQILRALTSTAQLITPKTSIVDAFSISHAKEWTLPLLGGFMLSPQLAATLPSPKKSLEIPFGFAVAADIKGWAHHEDKRHLEGEMVPIVHEIAWVQ